jgi:hypothetical protein
VVAIRRRFFESERVWAFRSVWIALAVGFVVYHAVALVSGAQSHSYFVWHRSPVYVFWVITFSAAGYVALPVISRVVSRSASGAPDGNRPDRGGWAERTTGRALACIGAALMVFSVVRMFAPPSVDPTQMLAIRYRAALWMAENLPRDATCAAWNAGQLGFYAPQRVVNLDGLVNSVEYYDDVLEGERSLEDYLHDNSVAYVVDYVANDLTAGLETVHAFPVEADGRVLRVWRLPPRPRTSAVARPRVGCLSGGGVVRS